MRKSTFFILFLSICLLCNPLMSYATHTADTSTNGRYYWDDGSYYGQLGNGVPNGLGTGTYVNGETYTGQWSNGYMNGHGTYRWPDSKLYVGNWQNGHMNGQGMMIYGDGSTYSGEFYQDRPTGNGTSCSDKIRVIYNNRQLNFDVDPVSAYTRVMVPVRTVFEAAGADVGWDGTNQKVMIQQGGTKIFLVIDKDKAQVNGEDTGLDVAPFVYKERVFVPLRFVSEHLGASVAWDGVNRVVWINSTGNAEIIVDDADNNDVPVVTPSYPEENDGYSGPTLDGWVENGHLALSWTKCTASDFNGYKVVISQYDSSPAYPENGYLFFITDRNQTTAKVDNSSGYNGGDFGGKLQPGQKYYFSITALYSGHSVKVPGNVITLTYPK